MTRRTEASALLTDIKCAAKDIMNFIEGMDYVTYADDNRTQAAVERKFEIIGEALNHLSQTSPEIAERIPELREVVSFRNLLIHGYAIVNPNRVWDHAMHDLPKLYQVVQMLLAEIGVSEA